MKCLILLVALHVQTAGLVLQKLPSRTLRELKNPNMLRMPLVNPKLKRPLTSQRMTVDLDRLVVTVVNSSRKIATLSGPVLKRELRDVLAKILLSLLLSPLKRVVDLLVKTSQRLLERESLEVLADPNQRHFLLGL
jgi:hypothetical protein